MTFRLLALLAVITLPAFATDIALHDGEVLTYRVSWGIFGRAGEIEIAARRLPALTPDLTAPHPLQITTTTSTRGLIRAFYPFDGQAELRFEPATDRLLVAEAKTQAKKRATHASMTLDYDAAQARYVDHLRTERNLTLDLPPGDPLDMITSLIQTRTWNIKVGESLPALVLFDDEFYALTITAEGIDRLDTPWGPRDALRLVPSLEGEPRGIFKRGGSVRVWVSQDEQRLPLRFEVALKVGTGIAILTDYTPPFKSASVATPQAAATTETAKASPPNTDPRNQSLPADRLR